TTSYIKATHYSRLKLPGCYNFGLEALFTSLILVGLITGAIPSYIMKICLYLLYLACWLGNAAHHSSSSTYPSTHIKSLSPEKMERNSTCHVDVPLKDVDWSFTHKFPLQWSLGL